MYIKRKEIKGISYNRLKLLCKHNLIRSKSIGRCMYYSLDDINYYLGNKDKCINILIEEGGIQLKVNKRSKRLIDIDNKIDHLYNKLLK